MHWKFNAIFYVALLIAPVVAQQPYASSRAEVQLESCDGKIHFKLGDLIQLELVFKDSAFPDVRDQLPAKRIWMALPGQMEVNDTDYGDIADEVTITPSTGWFKWQGRSGHDYGTQTPLDAKGVRIPLLLNQGYVFREPGHYEISVTTWRMRGQPRTTNAVGIDLTARAPDEEAALVSSLTATIANTDGKQRQEAAQELAALPGDEAARAKVQWLLRTDDDVAAEMSNGLAATRNQELQLELLRAAWCIPTHAPDGNLQAALKRAEAFVRGQMEPGWTMVGMPRDDPAASALAAEFYADLDCVIATLPQRTGAVRTDTAYYLMEDNKLSPDQLARVKPVVLEEFSSMEPIEQAMLIETRWSAIKDASLAPELKAMIESETAEDAATALERLVEMDERAARPYVVKMICRSGQAVQLKQLTGVKVDRLPEVDACLASLLAKGERAEHDFVWERAAERAARFASPAILPVAKASWTNASQDSLMLALLARDAPGEAVKLLNREPGMEWFPTNSVYEALDGRFPPELLAWLRRPDAPKSALYELSQFGEPQDRVLLGSRLDDLRERWRGHQAEMRSAQPDTPGSLAKDQEQELVSDLLAAKAWTMTAEEKRRMIDGCLSEECKRYVP